MHNITNIANNSGSATDQHKIKYQDNNEQSNYKIINSYCSKYMNIMMDHILNLITRE